MLTEEPDIEPGMESYGRPSLEPDAAPSVVRPSPLPPPAAKGGFPIFLCCVVCLCCVLIIATLLGVLAFLVYPIIADAYFFPTELWEYKDFAVVCDAPLCAGVAKQIYDKGGLIGDIAVAALLCMGVTAPHLAGLGGGFMALYYNQSTGEIEGLDALGASPAAATVDTYTNNKSGSEIGAKAPIVPGAYAGYKLLHKKYGKMKWKDLFEPAIKLAQSGFKIGAHLAFALQVNQGDLGSVDKAKEIFMDKKGQFLKANDTLLQKTLAETLRRLSADTSKNGDIFYGGEIGDEIASDISSGGGIMTIGDITDYKPKEDSPVKTEIDSNMSIYSVGFPGSGAMVGAVLDGLKFTPSVLEGRNSISYPTMGEKELHRLVEKVKFALAKRQTIEDNTFVEDRLYDKISGSFKQDFLEWASRKSFKDYNLDLGLIPDYGGAQLSIRDAQGNALSITSGLNHEFGSKFWTSNGILMNSYMDAFPQKGRFFSAEQDPITKNPPGKDMRPLTSLMPTIILNGNQKGPRLHAVMGATGGLAAISALAQLAACSSAFPLFRCVNNNVGVTVTVTKRGRNFDVKTEGSTEEFNPDHMLIKRNNTVLKEPFQQTATAIMTTARNSWMAPADVVHADGSSAGEPYKHPLWNNKRS